LSDEHLPVMPDETIQALAIDPGGIYIDCTFGRGGHSRLILEHLEREGRLLAFDRDAQAANSKTAHELRRDPKFRLEKCNLMNLETLAASRGWLGQVTGVLMDLGVSSPQLDDASRGFSFMRDGPLDMRMDTTTGGTAAEWIDTVSERELVRILKTFGEERYARRIARAVVKSRGVQPIRTTLELARLIEQTVPRRDPGKHPATRSFQAIRIHLNRELEELKTGLEQAVKIMKPAGRLVVISFHSLEDRIVKRFIRRECRGEDFPPRLPVMASAFSPRLRSLGRAVRAGDREVTANPRARSAVLRAAERVGR
jgi:16S rRNA (cytosine1402-N4)-methyltransferase